MLIYDELRAVADADDYVLDVGCKDGRHLAGNSAATVAIDVDVYPTQDDVDYCYADGRRMPFPDDTFDYVVSNQVLEHVPNDTKANFVSEIARVLAPGGTALFSFPNPFWPGNAHCLPPLYALLPRPLALRLGTAVLSDDQFDYYRDHVFNISTIRARSLFRTYFDSVEYATLDILLRDTELTNPSWRRARRVVEPFRRVLTGKRGSRAFELGFPYAAYECKVT